MNTARSFSRTPSLSLPTTAPRTHRLEATLLGVVIVVAGLGFGWTVRTLAVLVTDGISGAHKVAVAEREIARLAR